MILNKPYNEQDYIDFVAYANNHNCTIEDKGEYIETVEVIPPAPTKEEQIESLKSELATYDYIGIKIAMGVATKEEYADKIAYTQTLRQRINELEDK